MIISCVSVPEGLENLRSCRLGVVGRAGDDLTIFLDLLELVVGFSESDITEPEEVDECDSFRRFRMEYTSPNSFTTSLV